ncbi:MAG: hypothetical protein HY395_01645 [Candidatus Doudnabacteria bacterium]|nr:hypothetical protein [Candidatus Doudnabacteria bacterium]
MQRNASFVAVLLALAFAVGACGGGPTAPGNGGGPPPPPPPTLTVINSITAPTGTFPYGASISVGVSYFVAPLDFQNRVEVWCGLSVDGQTLLRGTRGGRTLQAASGSIMTQVFSPDPGIEQTDFVVCSLVQENDSELTRLAKENRIQFQSQ